MRIRQWLSRFRLVRKPSSRITVMVLAGTLVVSLVALLILHSLTLQARNDAEYWRNVAQTLEQQNQQLTDKIGKLGTLEGIKDIAQEVLGMVFPDTVIITPDQ